MSDEELNVNDDADEDDGDDEENEEFDEDLVIRAKSVGLNPDNFDNEDDLDRETDALVNKKQAETGDVPADKEQEALAMAALEIILSAKGEEELDPEVIKNLKELAKGSGENFKKLAERLRSGDADNRRMRGEIKQLVTAMQTLNAQNIQLAVDNWIRGHDEVQAYLGKNAMGDLDVDGKFARRRRSLVRKADNIASHQRGSFTTEQMLAKAFKKMQKPGTTKTKGKKAKTEEDTGPTQLARASGTKTSDLVGSDPSREALDAEAAAVVGKCRRNSR